MRRRIAKERTKVRNGLRLGVLKHHSQGITIVGRLEDHDIIFAHHFQDFTHIRTVESQSERFITTIVVKGRRRQRHGNERHVRRIHTLHGDFLFGAIEIAVGHEILDRINDILERLTVH